MRLFKNFSLTIAGLVFGTLLLSASASAQSAGGVGGRPAHPDPNNPRAQSIFIFTVDRGASASDTVLISNNSGETKTVELYAVDGTVTSTGSYTCAQKSEAKLDVGNWISLAQNSVTLDSGKTAEVSFKLAMPNTADVGEHNGCIVFQEKTSDDTGDGNVRVLTRQAIRVAATVPGTLHREVSLTSFTVGSLENNPMYTLKIQNNGNVSADVDAKVQLTTIFGGVVYENGGGYPVLANQQLELSFVDKHRPFFGGWYYTSGSASYDKRAGTFGTDDAANLVTKQTNKELIFLAPTPLGLLTLILLALGIIVAVTWLTIRYRRKVNARKTWKTYTVKKGDNIQTIAGRANINWKKLAKANKLTAPYILAVGQKLKAPAINKKQTRNSKKTSTS